MLGKMRKLPSKVIPTFQEFFALESSSGVLLLVCTAIAIIWANVSPENYFALWNDKFTAQIGALHLPKNLHYWINDGLMVIFFFVVGLEIKRELISGELRSPRQAALPIIAAFGGALTPALIYFAINSSGSGSVGWGIPMATDIAFALAVLSLLGSRVPIGLKVFLTALAIVDDLIAVLVIAIFYSAQIDFYMLLAGLIILITAFLLNRAGVNHVLPYALLGLSLWYVMFHSGVHATVAGVLIALAIPAKAKLERTEFVANSKKLVANFERCGLDAADKAQHVCETDIIHALHKNCERAEPTLVRLEHALHPWVAYAIVPLFALANAGVVFNSATLSMAIASSISWGVFLGLLLGNQIGVNLFSWLAVKLGIADLPAGVTWRHIYGASWLAAIGFTMSLFIAGLAFDGQDGAILDQAKIGILFASLVAGVIGWLLLRRTTASQGGTSAK